ncbi:transcriptional regulator (TetR-family protein) [Desulforapulum autotrophicum HRM2]|uniref:Transcriptional regulator (TetR-family protein) n=1 Tax=Desulforapulum autotrophicum (strain ATCC 43914 / DSM 3382 / VKM B-1955 / HRM2) TaxID=177437 RepID=C0QL28_DESAH|nr:TetR/AcrR family transcriptional regulator [Desulforapulum autotrophicum]ACN14114.1 transcriptional regulator (TetR-family protein) [Desulforapulum autotrophicum HRM2]
MKKGELKEIRKDQSEVPTQIKNPELVVERRRQIVDSTVHLFVEHGYHKTTTRMIAKAAGFSIGSLYEYVGSKEDVLYLVCEAIHAEVERAVEATLSGEVRGKETLAEVIREYFHVCDSMSDHVLLMYQVTQFLPKKWQIRALENELRITDIFVQVINKLSGKVDFPLVEEKTVTMLAHNISVLGHMWAFRRWDLARHFTIDEYIEYQTDFVLGRLIA